RYSRLEQLTCSPNNHNQEANQRHIGVSICHRLDADLNQPDHRHQHSEEPKPADPQIRAASSKEDDYAKNRQQNRCASQHLPERPISWMWIQDGKLGWPEGFADVPKVRNHSIGHSRAQGDTGRNGASMTLDNKSHIGGTYAQREKWNFFQQQSNHWR